MGSNIQVPRDIIVDAERISALNTTKPVDHHVAAIEEVGGANFLEQILFSMHRSRPRRSSWRTLLA